MGSREIGSNNFVQLERTHTDHTQTGRTAKLKRQEESRNLRETHPTAFESGSSRAEAGLATVAAPTARGGAGGRETPPAYNAITLRQADTLVASRPEATGANAHTVAAMFILGYKNEGGEFEFIGNADSHKAKHLVSTLGAARTSGNLKETLAQLADEGVLKEIQTVSVQCKDPELQRQLDKYLAKVSIQDSP